MSISLSIICRRSLQCLVQMLLSTFQIYKIRLDEIGPVSLRKEQTSLSHTHPALRKSSRAQVMGHIS